MSALDNGGPAFPIADAQMVHKIGAAAIIGITDPAERDRVYIEVTAAVAAGMTLRDYAIIKFAAAWTVALASNRHGTYGYSDTDAAYEALHLATKQADAMLAERAK